MEQCVTSNLSSSAFQHVRGAHKIFYYFILFCIFYVSFDGYVMMWRHNVSRTPFRSTRIHKRGERMLYTSHTTGICWWQSSQCAHNQSKFNGRIAFERRSSETLYMFPFGLPFIVSLSCASSLSLSYSQRRRWCHGVWNDITGKQIC